MKQCGQAEAKENGGCWREAGDRGEVWTAGGRKGRGEDAGKAQRRDTGKTGAGSGEKGWRKGKEEKTEHKPGLRQRTWRGPMRSPKSRLASAEQRM